MLSPLRDAIAITGRSTTPVMSGRELPEEIASAFAYEGHAALENVIAESIRENVAAFRAEQSAKKARGDRSGPCADIGLKLRLRVQAVGAAEDEHGILDPQV